MSDLKLKYNLLDNSAQREVLNFIDFLLSKKKKQSSTDWAAYRQRILKIPVWSDEDIEFMEVQSKRMNQWKIEEW
ncbi:MAG: hypothetical protein AAF806_27735 [Bacteroidota bacterium]